MLVPLGVNRARVLVTRYPDRIALALDDGIDRGKQDDAIRGRRIRYHQMGMIPTRGDSGCGSHRKATNPIGEDPFLSTCQLKVEALLLV